MESIETNRKELSSFWIWYPEIWLVNLQGQKCV